MPQLRGLEQLYWGAAASPSGTLVALWLERPDRGPEWQWPPDPPIMDPDDPDEILGLEPEAERPCIRRATDYCKLEYVAELWSVDGKPRRIWRTRPEGHPRPGYTEPRIKRPSGPIAFAPDSSFVVLGFEDGDVVVRGTEMSAISRTESLHRAPVTRIEVAPGGRWVFSEDAEGEQRIWPL